MQTRNFDRSQMSQYRSPVSDQIEKELSYRKIIYKDRIARDQYSYQEDRKIIWKILPETTKIGDYKVQKAEADFGGRKWIAWFSQDIPVMDGPYKFSSLPGLILKAEDSTGDYSFDLKETKKITQLPPFFNRGGNVLSVRRTDYEKQMTNYKNDAVSFLNAQSGMRGGRMEARDGAVSRQPDPQRLRDMANRIMQELKKNNNPIEK